MNDSADEARRVVDEIWSEATAAACRTPPEPLGPYEPLVEDNDRRYLNDHATLPRPGLPTADGGGLRQRAADQLARQVAACLEPRLAAEDEFRGYLIRLMNTLTVAHDQLREEIRRVERENRHLEARITELERRLDSP